MSFFIFVVFSVHVYIWLMFEVVEERCEERVEECGSENLEVAGVDAAVVGGAGDGVG